MSVYLYICIDLHIHVYRLPRWPRVKNPPASAGGVGSIPGPGRSPGEGNGNPLQYCCLGNPMGRGAWWVYSSGGCKESDMTWLLNNSNSYVCVCVYIYIYIYLDSFPLCVGYYKILNIVPCWRIAYEQGCDGFRWTARGLSHTHTCIHVLVVYLF